MTSPTLASAPGDCCVKGFEHEGTPTGKTSEIGGVETYVSEPSGEEGGQKKIILFFTDVFSSLHLNNQLLMDYFAKQGMHWPGAY